MTEGRQVGMRGCRRKGPGQEEGPLRASSCGSKDSWVCSAVLTSPSWREDPVGKGKENQDKVLDVMRKNRILKINQSSFEENYLTIPYVCYSQKYLLLGNNLTWIILTKHFIYKVITKTLHAFLNTQKAYPRVLEGRVLYCSVPPQGVPRTKVRWW